MRDCCDEVVQRPALGVMKCTDDRVDLISLIWFCFIAATSDRSYSVHKTVGGARV